MKNIRKMDEERNLSFLNDREKFDEERGKAEFFTQYSSIFAD